MLNLKDKVLDHTLYIKEFMNPPLIKLINNVFYSEKAKELFSEGRTVNRDSQDTSLRSVETASLAEEQIGNSVSKRIIYNDIRRFTSKFENLYKEKVSSWYFSTSSHFEFLYYKKQKGGHYIYHTDYYKDAPRNLTILVGLNSANEYEGGELLIHNQEKGIKLDVGDVVAFPSNFMYPHKVEPLKSGERKVLVIWTQ